MSILNLLNSNDYQIYNRTVSRELDSIYAAIMLSELINRREYHIEKGHEHLEHEGKRWFYYTVDKCKERTDFGVKMQSTAIKKLKARGLIKVCQKGLPAKRYFWLDEEKILELFLDSKSKSRSVQRAEQEPDSETDLESARRPTSHIYKNPSKEPKEREKERNKEREKGGKPPNPPRAPHVFSSDDEHRKLAEEYGEELRDQAYQVLSDWKEDTPKSKWKKSDYRSIRRWVIDSIKEKKPSHRSPPTNRNQTCWGDAADSQYHNRPDNIDI